MSNLLTEGSRTAMPRPPYRKRGEYQKDGTHEQCGPIQIREAFSLHCHRDHGVSEEDDRHSRSHEQKASQRYPSSRNERPSDSWKKDVAAHHRSEIQAQWRSERMPVHRWDGYFFLMR